MISATASCRIKFALQSTHMSLPQNVRWFLVTTRSHLPMYFSWMVLLALLGWPWREELSCYIDQVENYNAKKNTPSLFSPKRHESSPNRLKSMSYHSFIQAKFLEDVEQVADTVIGIGQPDPVRYGLIANHLVDPNQYLLEGQNRSIELFCPLSQLPLQIQLPLQLLIGLTLPLLKGLHSHDALHE